VSEPLFLIVGIFVFCLQMDLLRVFWKDRNAQQNLSLFEESCDFWVSKSVSDAGVILSVFSGGKENVADLDRSHDILGHFGNAKRHWLATQNSPPSWFRQGLFPDS
jgi:hypothetical protein